MPTLFPYDLSERAAAGREVYARTFVVSPAEAERLMTLRAGPGRQSDALTDRDRSIAVIAALVSRVTEGLTALMVLLSAYVGQPHTSVAAEAVQRSAGAEQ